ncbi:hypothetical protein IWW57_001817, partial [Coemansia sp. S610]
MVMITRARAHALAVDSLTCSGSPPVSSQPSPPLLSSQPSPPLLSSQPSPPLPSSQPSRELPHCRSKRRRYTPYMAIRWGLKEKLLDSTAVNLECRFCLKFGRDVKSPDELQDQRAKRAKKDNGPSVSQSASQPTPRSAPTPTLLSLSASAPASVCVPNALDREFKPRGPPVGNWHKTSDLFCLDTYKYHLHDQHKLPFELYEELKTDAERLEFLELVDKSVVTVEHFTGSSGEHVFNIGYDIIEGIVLELFGIDNATDVRQASVEKLFTPVP